MHQGATHNGPIRVRMEARNRAVSSKKSKPRERTPLTPQLHGSRFCSGDYIFGVGWQELQRSTTVENQLL